jgi:hypothetical protein
MLDQGEEELRMGNRGVVRAARIKERRNGEWGTAFPEVSGGGVMRLGIEAACVGKYKYE